MTWRSVRCALVLVPVVVAGACSVFVAPAEAVIVRLTSGRAVSYMPLSGAAALRAAPALRPALRPFDALFTNLDYNGGPIMPSNTNYTLYWAPSGSPAYPSGYKTGVNRYLEDLAHDSGGHENVDSVATQYNDAAGEFANYNSHFAGELVDTDPYPANGCSAAPICLTDAQIQTEIKHYVTTHALPEGLTTEYFLLTPPGVEDCFEASGEECSAGSSKAVYCAYHSNIPSGATQIIYANDPYVTEIEGCDDGRHPNNSPSDGALEGGLSHEHNESITDPEPNNAWTNFVGSEAVQGEIGDKCATEMGTPVGETASHVPYNQVINGHFYFYQEEWSNQGHQCLQRFTFAGEANTAKFNATPVSGAEVNLDASASTAPGGVSRYSWQFNEEPGGGQSTPVETLSSTLTHSFSSAGTHVVALTIYASNGTSIGAAKTILVGAQAPTAAFSVTTPSPTAGLPVGFDASASSPHTGSISSYEWTFGDGSTGSGVTPTHTYAAPGSYEAVLSVTDGSGLTTTVTHSVVVAPSGTPTLVTEPSSDIEQASATLNGTVNPHGSNVTDCHFEYGLTIAYGWNAPCQSLPGAGMIPVAVSAAAVNLSPDTTYHYRIVATNGQGENTGSDVSFETAFPPATVTTDLASNVGQTSATFNGAVNANGSAVSDCRFEYGATTEYGASVPCSPPLGAGSATLRVSATVSDLSPGNAYHYRIAVTNAGGVAHGLDRILNTSLELSGTSTSNSPIVLAPASTPSPGAGRPTPTPTPKHTVKPLTRAQRLAIALRACRRLAKRKQAACVKRARARYGINRGKAHKRPSSAGP
jgi:PKD repeat protein